MPLSSQELEELNHVISQGNTGDGTIQVSDIMLALRNFNVNNGVEESVSVHEEDSSISHEPVSINSMKVMKFWPKRPRAWFEQLEGEFLNHKPQIKNHKTKYYYLVSTLDHSTLDQVAEIVEKPYYPGKYEELKISLLDIFDRSQEERDLELLSLESLDGRKPSELLKLINDLYRDPESLRRTLFLRTLPQEIRIFASESDLPLRELAKKCDKMLHIGNGSISRIYSVNDSNSNFGDNNDSMQSINRIKRKKTFPSKHKTNSDPGKLCWYHSKYGLNAKACEEFCIMNSKTNTLKSKAQGNEQAATKSQW